MWALLVVGPALERQLGSARYLAVYIASAIGGSVSYYFLAPPNQPALGASGAIFGLFGAWFVIARRLGLDARGVVFLIVVNLALGFVVPYIAWQAHVGGLVTGAALTAAYVYAPQRKRGATQLSATVAVLAVLALGVIVRDHQLVGVVLG
jgi:membrane associated rhomboid family serine protease